MGFFSEIVSETRRGMRQKEEPKPVPPIDIRPPTAPKPVSAPAAAPETPPAPEPKKPPTPAPASAAPEDPPDPPPATPAAMPGSAPAPAGIHAEGKPEPVPAPAVPEAAPTLDLSSDADAADEAERKRKHEAVETKRKAEFDARQAKKKAARQERLDQIKAMSDAELLAASAERVAADTERLTRRNMKEAVAEHIQARCRSDATFARLVMDPDKSMISCFRYINRKAREYAEQEMKDLGIERTGTYGIDVPDGTCFKWAEDYFNDPDAKEDKHDEEKFVPKPYVPNHKTSKTAPAKKKSEKKKPASGNAKAPEKPKTPELEQMSLI